MSAKVSSADVERFRSLIAQRLALWFDDGKLEYLASILERRIAESREPPASYLFKLEGAAKTYGELKELAQELTVGETYFFRHSDQFRAFVEVALPRRVEARATSRHLKMLSAGCSSGEEAYTLSILTQEHLAENSWNVSIIGMDINPSAVERARRGRYSTWSLRATPEDVQKRYFAADGRDYVLAKAIRDSVTFVEQNLVGDDVWLAESYDVVFCRNVLMYFTPAHAQRVIERLARALAPGGYLFLGYAENLRGISQDFELLHTHETFYYRRKGALVVSGTAPERTYPGFALARADEPPAADWANTWLDTVQRSSDRIRALTEKPQASVQPARPVQPAAPDLTLALELFSHERFSEALDVLSRLPADAVVDRDAVLLRAALLTHCGRLEQAESACSELLALDGLSAGAHYLKALCRERSGDAQSAIEHAQIACYLDPVFAMPHLHLGLMARRAGDRATAQRELSQAAALLQREDPSRLLLFGGGFHRDGLVALCLSELARLGDPS